MFGSEGGEEDVAVTGCKHDDMEYLLHHMLKKYMKNENSRVLGESGEFLLSRLIMQGWQEAQGERRQFRF